MKLGDKIDTYYIQDDIRARRLKIVGIYQTNLAEYDNLFMLTDLCLVNRLNKWESDQASGIELSLRDYNRLEEMTYEIGDDLNGVIDRFGQEYCVRNIEQLNPSIFAWLGILDVNIWVILVLMIGVAGFTMISGLLIIMSFLSGKACCGAMLSDWLSTSYSVISDCSSSIPKPIIWTPSLYLSTSGCFCC